MRHLLLTFMAIILIFSGCGSDPKPQVQAPVILKPAKQITLYNQTLTPSEEMASKAFSVQEITVSLKPNVNYMGMEQANGFTFTIAPLLKYNFDKDYQVLQADIRNLLPLTDDAVFENRIQAHIQNMDLVYADLSREHITLTPTQERIKTFKRMPTKNLTFAIKSLFSHPKYKASNKYTLSSKDLNVSFSFYNPSFTKAIISETLMTRKDALLNEALLHNIAKVDDTYYQQLLQNKEAYIIPEHSIMFMPEDADLSYAIEKSEVFFNTGKYKTKSGKYKIIIPDEMIQFDQSSTNVQGTHSIKTKQNKKRLKKATDIPDHDNFIDFSEGVE